MARKAAVKTVPKPSAVAAEKPKRVTRKTTPSPETLAPLGLDRLIGLVLDETARNPAFKKLVTAAIAGLQGPDAVAALIDRRLTALERAHGYIDWQKRRSFAADLDATISTIVSELAPLDVDAALNRCDPFPRRGAGRSGARRRFQRPGGGRLRTGDACRRRSGASAPSGRGRPIGRETGAAPREGRLGNLDALLLTDWWSACPIRPQRQAPRGRPGPPRCRRWNGRHTGKPATHSARDFSTQGLGSRKMERMAACCGCARRSPTGAGDVDDLHRPRAGERDPKHPNTSVLIAERLLAAGPRTPRPSKWIRRLAEARNLHRHERVPG